MEIIVTYNYSRKRSFFCKGYIMILFILKKVEYSLRMMKVKINKNFIQHIMNRKSSVVMVNCMYLKRSGPQ